MEIVRGTRRRVASGSPVSGATSSGSFFRRSVHPRETLILLIPLPLHLEQIVRLHRIREAQ